MSTLNELAQRIHDTAASKGFWDSDRNIGEMLMLAVSELSEALEEHRSGNGVLWLRHQGVCGLREGSLDCSCVPKPEGIAVEVVDCIIRCLDLLSSLDVDVDDVMERKMQYNSQRPHKHDKAY